ncbi:endonuclease domain-containing protein [bacterium]|nr:endonuclease domain-containing protein [bacterium]
MKRINHLPEVKDYRRELRKNATPQEVLLWARLRRKNIGHRFRRQHSFGKFIVDFYCPEKKLVIEIDGSQHEENLEYDSERTRILEELGICVLRFWNNEVDKNIDGVMMKIMKSLLD